MPHISAAMQRSLRRGVGDIMLNSLVGKRGITGEVDSVKNTFSSWDNCMAKGYCKWPVIAAIVIVSLIVLSIVTCIARCCCCGYSCCCSCFSFLKCCDCCGDSCEGKRNKPMKHRDEPEPFGGSSQPYNQGYQAPAPMMGGALPVAGKPGPPQYAQFEVGKSGLAVDPTPTPLSEDALPPMPSWDAAAKKHVLTEDEKNGVELGELDPTTGQHVPLMAGAIATGGARSPIDDRGPSPFGARPGPGAGGTGYMGVSDEHYDQNQAAYNVNGRGYGGSPGMGPGMGPSRLGTPQMRGAPGGMRRPGGPGGFDPNSPQNYNGQSRGYGPPSPNDSYAQNDGFAAVPVGGGRGYGRPPPQRQFSNDQYGDDQSANRQFPPQPSRQFSSDSQQPLTLARQYSDGPGYPQESFQPNGPPPRGPSRGPGPNRLASPPLQNNSGFDFGGDQQGYQSRPSPSPQQYQSRPSPPQQYSRPSPPQEQMSYGSSNRPSPPAQNGRVNEGYFGGSTAAPSYASRTPPPQEPTYPGYKPYQPNSGGRGREPQGWDPVQQ